MLLGLLDGEDRRVLDRAMADAELGQAVKELLRAQHRGTSGK